MTDEVPEADALEQERPVAGPPAGSQPPAGADVTAPDVPAADAIEQELPARGPVPEEEPTIAPEVPEADALEQTQPAPLLDEDELAASPGTDE